MPYDNRLPSEVEADELQAKIEASKIDCDCGCKRRVLPEVHAIHLKSKLNPPKRYEIPDEMTLAKNKLFDAYGNKAGVRIYQAI
jgi:hypothetical protein